MTSFDYEMVVIAVDTALLVYAHLLQSAQDPAAKQVQIIQHSIHDSKSLHCYEHRIYHILPSECPSTLEHLQTHKVILTVI